MSARVSDLLERLRGGPCLLLDGGFGSELIARGLEAGGSPDRWTLERSADVLGVHRAYVEAGSEAIHANTFGANRARLARHGLAGRIEEINLAAVRLAREAGARYVIADIGPSGEHLPPVGRATLGEWRHAFERAWPAIAAQGFDERFRRLWLFYLAYCEAGFATGTTDVAQFTLERPA